MKFIVSSAALSGSLQAISRVILSKNVLPILDSFLFTLEDGTLSATASDGDTTLRASLEVSESDSNGRFTIDAGILLNFLKEMPDQPLSFNVDLEHNGITILYQNGKAELVGQDADEFPQTVLPSGEKLGRLELDVELLLKGFNYCMYAPSTDDFRPIMTGIYCDISPESLTMVASDGHTLVRYMLTNLKGNEKAAFNMPKKPASLLRNLLTHSQGKVFIEFNADKVAFMMPSFMLVTRLLDGRYPNYNSVIPSNNPYKLTIDRMLFLNASRRASVISSNDPDERFTMEINSDHTLISTKAVSEGYSLEENLTCQYSGDPLTINFKTKYIIEILSSISTDNVVLELADPTRAVIISPLEQAEGESLLMLLMPYLVS